MRLCTATRIADSVRVVRSGHERWLLRGEGRDVRQSGCSQGRPRGCLPDPSANTVANTAANAKSDAAADTEPYIKCADHNAAIKFDR